MLFSVVASEVWTSWRVRAPRAGHALHVDVPDRRIAVDVAGHAAPLQRLVHPEAQPLRHPIGVGLRRSVGGDAQGGNAGARQSADWR